MATTATIKKNIAKLEAALKSKATPKSLKPKLETQLVKSKAELSGMSKGTKPKTSSTKSTQTALQKLKAMVNKNKKYKTYKGAGVDLEKDADRPALKTGRRIAKESGNTYYEYRANRIDVKQPPKKYPKLEKGGEIDSEAMMLANNAAWDNQELRAEYKSLKKDLQNLNNGLLKPSKVIGTGYKSSAIAKRLAKEWLEKNIAVFEKTLEIRGAIDDDGMMAKGGEMADGGRLRWNNVSIHINKNTEEDMRNAGFAFEPNGNAPLYYNGKEVGFLSNFNGVMLNDEYVDQLVPMFNNFRGAGVWNYRGWKEEAESKKRQYSSKMAKGGQTDDFYDNLQVHVQGVGTIYHGQSMKAAIKKADAYLLKNPKAEVVIVDEKYGDEYDLEGNQVENEDEYAKGGYVAVSEKNDYWTIITKPTTKEKAQQMLDLGGLPRGEVGKVVTLEQAKAHKNTIGKEYLEKGGYMEKGGISQKEVAESNAEMVLSQIKAVKHHAMELSNVVSKNSDIEAWVVAKIERASTDLSDITHYLEFQTKKMAMGGEIHRTQD